MQQIPSDLQGALNALISEGLEGWAYNVRDAEGEGWGGPRVTAFGEACRVIRKYAEAEAHKEASSPPVSWTYVGRSGKVYKLVPGTLDKCGCKSCAFGKSIRACNDAPDVCQDDALSYYVEE